MCIFPHKGEANFRMGRSLADKTDVRYCRASVVFGAQEFSARRHIVKKRTHFDLRPRRFAAVAHRLDPSAVYQNFRAGDRPGSRVRQPKARNAGDARQRFAPKTKRADGCEISRRMRILLVACRSSESRASSRSIPQPSSTTRMREIPPRWIPTSIARAPASMLFSTSSFTTEAGRSTTSPAATWLARVSGRSLIRLIGLLTLDPFDSLRSLRTSFRFLILKNLESGYSRRFSSR